jgi:biotin synthase-related radical SAM superfamily protein
MEKNTKMPQPTNQPPSQIRASIGTAITLGLLKGKIDAEPTTAYLMTYKKGKCTANCTFCPQARTSTSNTELLSRITWPKFPTKTILNALENANNKKIKRICIQTLNYPNNIQHLTTLTQTIKQHTNTPISISCQPQNTQNLHQLKKAGANRIAIPLDATTQKIFNQTKGTKTNGPYNWKNQHKQLQQATKTFGKNNVTTHLIIGLGETEKQATKTIQKCTDMSVLPALFAFTPIPGTALENKPQPQIQTYRRIQLARHLIQNGITHYENIHFNTKGKITNFNIKKETLTQIVETGQPFLTTGCPNCNRPFYNEKPSGPIYNYPRSISPEEIKTIKQQLNLEPKP